MSNTYPTPKTQHRKLKRWATRTPQQKQNTENEKEDQHRPHQKHNTEHKKDDQHGPHQKHNTEN
jgi:hypothetical protein